MILTSIKRVLKNPHSTHAENQVMEAAIELESLGVAGAEIEMGEAIAFNDASFDALGRDPASLKISEFTHSIGDEIPLTDTLDDDTGFLGKDR